MLHEAKPTRGADRIQPRQRTSFSREPLLLAQLVLNSAEEIRRFRIYVGLEAGDDAPVPADEELGEVPAHLAAVLGIGFLGRQILVQLGRLLAVDGYLGEHVEVNSIVF